MTPALGTPADADATWLRTPRPASRPAALALAAAALALAAATPAAATPVPIDTCGGLWTRWPAGNPETVWQLASSFGPDDLPAQNVAAATQAAFAEWGRPGCSAFNAQQGNDTTASPEDTGDAVNAVGFVGPGWLYGPATLAITVPVYWQDDCTLTGADMVFNDLDVDWVLGAPRGGDEVDYQAVATHEAGHFVGLDHDAYPGSTLSATYSGGLDERTLSCSDTEGSCFAYPSGDDSCTDDRYCPCDRVCDGGSCVLGGDDDDDDAPCGAAPAQQVAESEPNDWLAESDVDTHASNGGDLRFTGSVTCGNDGSAYSADADWIIVDFPCVGDARFTLSWDAAAQVDFYAFEEGDDTPVASWESTDTTSPGVDEASTGGRLHLAVLCWSGATADYALTVDWRPFDGGGGGDDDDDDDDDDDSRPGSGLGSVETRECGCAASSATPAAGALLAGAAVLVGARRRR